MRTRARRRKVDQAPFNDPKVREEIRRIDTALDGLWDEQRVLRAQVRFGDRAKIVARAYASATFAPNPTPHGFVCLMIATAV